MGSLILLLINIRRLLMYIAKFSISTKESDFIDFIRTDMGSNFQIKIINSKGLLGTEGVDIAVVGQVTGIASAIAYTIGKFLQRNNDKSVTIENSKGKRTYSGYSVEEIKELESFIAEDVKEISD